MNPIEIEEQLSNLANEPFDAVDFPYLFLECFGNKATSIKSLRKGKANKTDIEGGVLQRLNIHMLMAEADDVDAAMDMLRASKATTKSKAKFIFATDGETVASENLATGDHLACDFEKLGENFTFFLPLAGIYFTAEIKNQDIDIKATARLNKLYMELLKENPDWTTPERRHDLNQFMARLIFCFFAEDTDIFLGSDLFTNTIKKLSDSRSGNVAQLIYDLFDVMDSPPDSAKRKNYPKWKNDFPYVNGGLFGGNKDVPKFSRIARSYMIAAGELNWSKINPDIFGSMIQAVADDDERGSLGMHYTSVPNILKVLNPLFLDDLREKLEEAGDNTRKLLNLRKRIANIRVFDPACGSGNFLVIAYKELRKIEAEILNRRSDENRNTVISLENFYGIEIKDFAAQIAQIALLIAEFQCDVLYINQVQACKNMLPLDKANNIVIGNALRLNWLEVCPPTAPVEIVKETDDDLFDTPLQQTEINLDEDNLGGETYICGNPPYAGKGKKEATHLEDMEHVFADRLVSWGYVDYVACWLLKAADRCRVNGWRSSLVTTNSISQGRQLFQFWPAALKGGVQITHVHESFKWSNNAVHNAGVICVIIGISPQSLSLTKKIYSGDQYRIVDNINAYLIGSNDIYVRNKPSPISPDLTQVETGCVLNDGGALIFSYEEYVDFIQKDPAKSDIIKPLVGSQEMIKGIQRFCLKISDQDLPLATSSPVVRKRLEACKLARSKSKKKNTREKLIKTPHQFEHSTGEHAQTAILIPTVSSESRQYLPTSVFKDVVINAPNYALYDAEIYNLALISSKLHLVWIATVCGKLKTDYRYSNTLGWNTFPVPDLTNENKADLTRCAEDILLARAAHFPKTIAELYKPEDMPNDLRAAHDRNDEMLERIYIGRRFKTDTERLETLFDLYTKMTAKPSKKARRA